MEKQKDTRNPDVLCHEDRRILKRQNERSYLQKLRRPEHKRTGLDKACKDKARKIKKDKTT
jgi:hypothetical protein